MTDAEWLATNLRATLDAFNRTVEVLNYGGGSMYFVEARISRAHYDLLNACLTELEKRIRSKPTD